jgi:hypothetical protein
MKRFPVSQLIYKCMISFATGMYWGCNKFLGPINISVFLPWWAEVENPLSSLSRIGFGRK